MNLKTLRSDVEWAHKGRPQEQALCDSALRQIEEALAVLSRFGHHFHLAEGHQPGTRFPRYVYHFLKGQRLVGSEWELKELGWGWYDSFRDAELAEGRDIQFAGRGGIRRKQLPAVNGGKAEFVDYVPNEVRIAAFKAHKIDAGPILSDSKIDT